MIKGYDEVFRVINSERIGHSSLIILCDHASNQLPQEFGSLGLAPEEFKRHIAYDLGAKNLTEILASLLKAPAILTNFSRLLIDCNRGRDDPTLVPCLSDCTIVPDNTSLTSESFSQRIKSFYDPYHQAIDATITKTLAKNIIPSLLSIHTFTPIWKGFSRPWHVSILWDKDPRLAQPLIKRLEQIRGIIVGNNEPYRGWLRGDTLWQHGTKRGLPHALIEIRQDQLTNEKTIHDWASRLHNILKTIINDLELKENLTIIKYYGSRTDDA